MESQTRYQGVKTTTLKRGVKHSQYSAYLNQANWDPRRLPPRGECQQKGYQAKRQQNRKGYQVKGQQKGYQAKWQ